MNFMKLYIGDYMRDTGTLSVAEHGAYVLMLMNHYATEQGLPCGRELYRLLRAETKVEREAIDAVCGKFWYAGADGKWFNRRADAEFIKAEQQRETNRNVGKLGGRPKRTETEPVSERKPNRLANGTEVETNHNPHQTPDTRHQKETPHTPRLRQGAAVGLQSWIEAEKAAGRKAVPDGDPVFAYADEVGIPSEFLRLAWLEFRHRYGQPDAKRYRDWRSVFRKAVRGNWLKLWWLDPASGQYGLTTVGQQAQRANAEKRAA